MEAIPMENANRAVMFTELGAWEQVLHLRLLPKPQVCRGHVLVRIVLRPVHDFDFVFCSDPASADFVITDKELFRRTGCIPGNEGGFGIIEEIGEGVGSWLHPGQRVHLLIYGSHFLSEYKGSWQDYMSVKEECVIPVPDGIRDEVAAQFSVNPWTVYGLHKDIQVPKGEFILITAATSTLSRLFIQLAKHEGCKIIGIVRRNNAKEEILALGAEAVINSTDEDVVKEVMEVTNGKGAYIGIDSVGGTVTKSVAASVRDGGEVWVISDLGSRDIVISQDDLLRKVQIRAWEGGPYFLEKGKVEAATRACWELFNKQIWELPPAIRFDLSEFQGAIRESRKCGRVGKVLLESKWSSREACTTK